MLMLTWVRRWAMKFSAFALTTMLSTAAFATSSGIDTPSGVGTLPLAVGGNEVINLQSQGSAPGMNFDTGMGINNPAYINMTGPFTQTITVNQNWTPGDQALSINSNQIWKSVTTGDPSLYFQWSAPGSPVQIGGNGGLATGNDLVVHGGVMTMGTIQGWYGGGGNQTLFGGSPQIFVNGDNHTGGGIAISDDGGFYDYNDGWITFNNWGSGTTGLRIAGSNGPGSGNAVLAVNGVVQVTGSTPPVISTQGAYISWNDMTYGTGETDFINNPGSGAGGFAFMLSNKAGTAINTAMFVDGSGKVGVNTTSPQATLDVNGNAAVEGALKIVSNTCAAGTPLVSDGQGGVVCGASSSGVTTYEDPLGTPQPMDLGMHQFCALGGLGTPSGNQTDGSHQLVYASGNVGNSYHWYAYLDQSASHWIGEIYVTCLN
jgi:hypothetical protein